MSIKNFKKNGEHIQFQINNTTNKFPIALINGIRRSIIADVPSYAIDFENIIFNENTSMINSDMLKFRIRLIPINQDEIVKISNLDDLTFSCSLYNQEPYKIYFTTEDMIVKVKDTIYPISKFIPSTKIIIGALKPNQKIDFTAKVIKKTMKNNGSQHMLPCTIGYTFEPDTNEIKKYVQEQKKAGKIKTEDDEKNELIIVNQRIYKKNSAEQPLLYNFQLETNGNISSEKLFIAGIDALKMRFEYIKVKAKGKQLNINPSDTNMDATDIILEDEDDTSGNLLNYTILNMKNIHFCGYNIPHYIDRKVYLRIALEKNNDEEHILKVFIEAIESIQDRLNLLIKDFKGVSKLK